MRIADPKFRVSVSKALISGLIPGNAEFQFGKGAWLGNERFITAVTLLAQSGVISSGV